MTVVAMENRRSSSESVGLVPFVGVVVQVAMDIELISSVGISTVRRSSSASRTD